MGIVDTTLSVITSTTVSTAATPAASDFPPTDAAMFTAIATTLFAAYLGSYVSTSSTFNYIELIY